jgi:hypothetical protein
MFCDLRSAGAARVLSSAVKAEEFSAITVTVAELCETKKDFPQT